MRAAKCSVLFFNACLLHGVGRELARGVTAWTLGLPNTVHHYFIVFDRQPETSAQYNLTALASTLFSAIVAVASTWLYTRLRSAAARLFAIYLAGFSGMAVLASFMLAASEGAVHDVAVLAGVPMVLQISLSIVGGVLLAMILWRTGSRLQPPLETIVIPFAVTMALRAVVYAPAPWPVALMMLYSSSYWLIAIAGALWYARRGEAEPRDPGPVSLWFSALALPLLLIAIVRSLVIGVPIGVEPRRPSGPSRVVFAATRPYFPTV